jgi:hypothetical protein
MKAEGIWNAKALGGEYGEDTKGLPVVRINVEITEGPSVGARCTYEEQINAKSALYASRSCAAVGWKGADLITLKADIDAFIEATGGATTVEIKHLEIKNGRRAGQIWDKVNSIGRLANPPLREASPDRTADANDAMRAAMQADRANAPEDHGGFGERPAAGGGGSSADDDIPFASCSITGDVNPIAAVLR